MTALEYLDSLIAGQKIAGLPVQPSELQFLRILLVREQA